MEPMWKGVVSVSEAAWAWHHETQFPLLPWSSQARGFFSERFAPEQRENQDMCGCTITMLILSDSDGHKYLERERCTAIQISLAYVLHQPFPTFPLVGPVNQEEAGFVS